MRRFDDFPMPKIPVFFYLWFGFCALLSMSVLIGVVYTVYKVCKHFGIM